jgi:uncharacterized protein YebE (UPF0316 family)
MEILNVVLWALFIFCLRVVGVAMGTVRMIFTVKGLKIPAALIGFFEMVVFVFALGWVFQDLRNIFNVIAYSTGFAVGTLVGGLIEEQMALGFAVVRITKGLNKEDLGSALRAKGYGVTVVAGEGKSGKVEILTVVVRRKDVANVTAIVTKLDPHAFITIQEARSVAHGYFRRGI